MAIFQLDACFTNTLFDDTLSSQKLKRAHKSRNSAVPTPVKITLKFYDSLKCKIPERRIVATGAFRFS